jgi:hypothetical protein
LESWSMSFVASLRQSRVTVDARTTKSVPARQKAER